KARRGGGTNDASVARTFCGRPMKFLHSSRSRVLTLVASPLLMALLGGCATAPASASNPSAALAKGEADTAPAPAASASAPKSGAAAQASASSSSLRPFAEIIKDAKRIDGLFTLWQKEDKVWLELKPSDLDHPFFMSPT